MVDNQKATSANITTAEDTASAPATPIVTPDAGATYTFTIVTQPVYGTAAVVGNRLVYTPSPDYNGPDSFTFRATDTAAQSVVGTATVTVTPVNDAPTAASASIATNEDTASAQTVPAVTDPDAGDTHTLAIMTQPVHGSASVVNNRLVYTPNANYNGPDSFTFSATDAGAQSVTGTAAVTVTPVNDAPTAASASITTNEDTASAQTAPTVSDADAGDTHTLAIVTQPAHGSAAVANNRLVYTPDLNYNGADSFSFSATDSGAQSIVGTAAVTVTPVNDAPTQTGASRSIYSGLAGGGSRAPWVDDVDIFDTATFQITSQPSNGTASLAGNVLTYTPNALFTSGTDSFAFTATDGGNASVGGFMRLVVFDDTALTNFCKHVSTVKANGMFDTRPFTHPCAQFQLADTRVGSGASPITIDYIRNWPSNTNPLRGIVVLIGGGDLTTNLAGNDLTGLATSSGGNFLVRTGQRFADAGFLAVIIERPSDQAPGNALVDQYRISAKHAVDIVGILKHTNSTNLPVFLVGTSRGAMSAVANNVIATGIAISSPVTSQGGDPATLYVGRPDIPSLQPSFVKRPTHVLRNVSDLCPVSAPANSQTLAANLTAAGVSVVSDSTTGGLQVTAPDGNPDHDPDVCGAFSFHGFLGIEPAAVDLITAWLNARVDELGTNKLPEAAYVTVPTAAGAAKQIDLAPLTRDADGDTLSYALSHATTVLGGSVVLNGSTVTYLPPLGVSNKTDHFVYVVTDGKGGVAAAVISVQIGA